MKTKGRLLSFFLALLMFASVLTVFQPLVAEAADGDPPRVEMLEYDLDGNQLTMWAQMTRNGNAKWYYYGFAISVNGNTTVYEMREGSLSNYDPFYHTITVNPGDNVWFEAIIKTEFGEDKDDDGVTIPENFEVSEDELLFDSEGGSDTFRITTSGSWRVDTSHSWIRVSSYSGSSNATITVTCSENTSGNSRSGHVNVIQASTGDIYRIDIEQEENDVEFDVSVDELMFTTQGGKDTFTITATSRWTITENLSWITLSSTSGSSDETVTVTCSKNTSSGSREGTITVKHAETGTSFTIDVYQEGDVVPPEVELTISDSEIALGDTITYEGIAIGNSFTLNTVTVGISYFTNESNFQNEIGESVYFRHTELSASSYEVGDTIKTGANQSITGTDNTSTNSVTMRMDRAGIYSITLHGYSSKYGKDVKVVKKFVVVEEIEEPEILSVTLSSSSVQVGKAFSITVITNSSAKGAAFFVDSEDNSIGTTVTASDTNTYVHTYVFNKTGKEDPATNADISNSRVIYVYPMDENGNVLTEADFEYVRITVNPAQYTFNDFSVHAAQTRIDQAVTIEWEAAASKNGATVYYNLWIADEKIAEKLTQTSYTLSVAQVKKIGAGSIGVMVMATAEGHRQKQAVGVLTIYPSGEVLPGDVNGDSEINADDVTQLRKYLANTDSTAVPRSATQGADVNVDGQINGKDLTALLVKMENGNIPMPKPEPEPNIPVTPEANHTYTVQLPLDQADLRATTGKTIFIMPQGGFFALRAYDENGKSYKINKAGINVEFSNPGIFRFGGDTLTAIRSGYCVLTFKQIVNGNEQETKVAIHVGKSKLSTDQWKSAYQYEQNEYEYVSMCLDLYFSMDEADHPEEYVDVEMSALEGFFDGLGKMDLIFESIVTSVKTHQFNGQIEEIKKYLASFIKEYGEYLATPHNSNDEQDVFEMLDKLLEFSSDLDGAFDDMQDVLDTYEKLKKSKADAEAWLELVKRLDEFKPENLDKLFNSNRELYYKVINDKSEYERIKDAIEGFSDGMNSAGGFGNKLKKSLTDFKVLDGISLGADFIQGVMYATNDYSDQIELLEKMRTVLSGHFNEDDEVMIAINSLIDDYENKALSAATDFCASLASMAFDKALDAVPLMGVVKFAADIVGEVRHWDEKREIQHLTLFSSAMGVILQDATGIFVDGIQDTSLDTLKYTTSIYLNLLLQQLEVALMIYPKNTKLQDEIDQIESVFANYLAYTLVTNTASGGKG